MNVSAISFGKSEKKHNLMKVLIPLTLAMGAPSCSSQSLYDDVFERADSIEICDTTINKAQNLGLELNDSIVRDILKNKTIVLDAGHGGTQAPDHPRALGAKFFNEETKEWVYEKDINLAITKKVQKYLEEFGANVVMTRDSDYYVPLEDRGKIARKNKGNIFVSIHANACGSTKISGVTIHKMPSSSSDTNNLGTIMNKRVSSAYDCPPRKTVYEDNFKVLKDTEKMPGVLVETGFMTCPNDQKLLINDEHQDKLAKDTAAGIIEFFAHKAKVL